MSTDIPPQSAPAYAEALAELDAILGELESGDADIDALAGRVQRAADLVRLCRERLDGARVEVERIVADLDGADLDRAGAGAGLAPEPPDPDGDPTPTAPS